ncbi:Recep_L_domain domain-containing protein [Caenorhabditis elegans]|nr:Recep_L_domain domain-containing protein [Caenorhabditis elegans]CDR32628.1 Recep_L_domain domain-containing protein [Caenorhabditis elegans]|eukprot:NP_001293873.1 Uncharacterized protein CELE_C48D1.5 [Caenorhabditis elegans]
MRAGHVYDPLIDHLLEDGCRYPVRQTFLEREFIEVVYGNVTGYVSGRIQTIVEDGFLDWDNFKQRHLEIPYEFPEVNGYIFVEDLSPICSKNGILFLRICFSKNPTRKFGTPDVFLTADGALFQFETDGHVISSSSCTFSGIFGRCKAKSTAMIFLNGNILKISSSSSPIILYSSWTLFGVIGFIIISFFLILLVVLSCIRIRKNTGIHKNRENVPNLIPDKLSLSHPNIPFIDEDSIIFDI